MEKLGDFSTVTHWYSKARRGVPQEVIEHVLRSAGGRSPFVLDLGCGTGISTRQLKDYGLRVLGADKHPAMIEEARKQSEGIEYVVAPAEALPFEDGVFDTVTAFSAFHWFANKEAAEEIKRVLKPGGHFITVNREDDDNFKRQAMDLLRDKLDRKGRDLDIAKKMSEVGFNNVDESRFAAEELYSSEGALALLRSSAWWKIVPEGQEAEILTLLEEIVERHKNSEGLLVRKLNFVVVTGS